VKIIKRYRNPKNIKTMEKNNPPQLQAEEQVGLSLSKNVSENLEKFKAFLQDSSDVVFREFKLGLNQISCALVYVDGLVDKSIIHEQIMKTMMYEISMLENNRGKPIEPGRAFEEVKNHVVTVADIKVTHSLDEAMLGVMSGEVSLIVDGFNQILIISARGWPARGIEEPETESVILGSKEGFSETLRVNTALLRRKCKDPNMVIKTIKLGRRSKTDIAYVYIKGITNENLVEEVEKRLSQIDVDGIFDSGQIEQWIQDNDMSPFPQVQSTQRPDKTVANLMEGRMAILVDNSPFALIVPAGLYQFYQSPEDYYDRWIISSALRSLRWIASILASFTPAIYVAIISFHPGFIPTELALTISASRANVPFPAFVEALLMEATIELLRESGVRLPKPIGQTIGIVGGIIIGDSAVRAGITSPTMVLIVALTAIASFIIPSYSAAIGLRLIRFPLMILAGTLGIYGVILGFIAINTHLVSLRSFGVNYMAPQAPIIPGDLKDFIIRLPSALMRRRPIETYPVDIDRVDQDNIKR
jgi:spore germination protein